MKRARSLGPQIHQVPLRARALPGKAGRCSPHLGLLNTGRVLADVPRQNGKSLPSLAPRNHFRMQTVEGLGLLSVQQFSCGAGGSLVGWSEENSISFQKLLRHLCVFPPHNACPKLMTLPTCFPSVGLGIALHSVCSPVLVFPQGLVSVSRGSFPVLTKGGGGPMTPPWVRDVNLCVYSVIQYLLLSLETTEGLVSAGPPWDTEQHGSRLGRSQPGAATVLEKFSVPVAWGHSCFCRLCLGRYLEELLSLPRCHGCFSWALDRHWREKGAGTGRNRFILCRKKQLPGPWLAAFWVRGESALSAVHLCR